MLSFTQIQIYKYVSLYVYVCWSSAESCSQHKSTDRSSIWPSAYAARGQRCAGSEGGKRVDEQGLRLVGKMPQLCADLRAESCCALNAN